MLPSQPAIPSATAASGLPCVVELGGGEGHLAEAVLRYWEAYRPGLRLQIGYRTVEVGARLRERQAAAVAGFAGAGWDVGWGSDLQEACAGCRPVVVFGNEFLDALPLHVVDVRGRTLREAYVTAGGGGLEQEWGKLSDEAAAEIELLFGTSDPLRLETITDDGVLEVSAGLAGLLRQVAEAMPAGSFVNIDYGEWFQGVPPLEPTDPSDRRWELEGRSRHRRTVRGYFKHHLEPDLLARAGSQDLTSDVDFAAVDLHGRLEGFETVLFTTLAAFLHAGGAEEELRRLRSGSGRRGVRRARERQTSDRTREPPRRGGSGRRLQGDGAGQGLTSDVARPGPQPRCCAGARPRSRPSPAHAPGRLLHRRSAGAIITTG